MKKNNNIQSKFEILRIISMILIILHHYTLHGGLLEIKEFGVNKYIGVICFLGRENRS